MGKTFGKLAIVAAAGYVTGLLFAPKSGKETRQDLKKKGDELKAEASVRKEQLTQATKDGVKSFKQGATKVEKEARGMAKSTGNSARVIRDEASRLSEEAKLRATRVKQEAEATAGNVRADIQKNVK